MNFIRPEIRALFRKYSEVIAGVALALLGVWNILGTGWVLDLLGFALLVLGAGIAFTALRRLRFPVQSDGPGVVEIDERQISYFSAYSGGTVSIENLARVTAVSPAAGSAVKDMHWHLEEDGGTVLSIPASAAGVERLFDAFAALDGVDYDKATKALHATEENSFVIWAKERVRLH